MRVVAVLVFVAEGEAVVVGWLFGFVGRLVHVLR